MSKAALDDFPSHIAGDLHGLRDGRALGDQPLQIRTGGHISTFIKRFEFEPDHPFAKRSCSGLFHFRIISKGRESCPSGR